MRAETGWGASTGAAAGASTGRRSRPRPQPWHPSGGSSSRPSAPNNGNASTQWGAPLKPSQGPRDTAQFWNPPHAQQGGTDQHSGEGPDSMWSQTLQQAFRPADARADREKAEGKVRGRLEQARHVRETELEAGPIKPKVQRMTWHEYNLLTPRQRAAVDFNTMLVKAVRKDKSSQEEYENIGPQESKQYEATLKRAFGSVDRGSDQLYAPETLAVLKQIKFHDVDSDLDDFLQLRVAITDKDLENLKFPANSNTIGGTLSNLADRSSNTPAEAVSEVQGQLAINTQKLEQKLADGNNMLRSMPAIAAAERNFILKRLGGVANKPKAGLGYQPVNYINTPEGVKPGDMNTYFIDAFDKLAGNVKDGTAKGAILGDVKTTLTDHGLEYQDFLDYANDRSGQAHQFGQDLGDVHGVKYRSPEEFRKMLGFGEGVRK